jgi:hypothetical protein
MICKLETASLKFFENASVISYGKNSLMENNEAKSLGDATIDGVSKTKFMISLDSE